MGKLKHGISGAAYGWFESYLKRRKQYVSINGFSSKDLPIYHGVQQGSVLGPLFFLYISHLHTAIKFCKVHHFADDTNLLHICNSMKTLNRFFNFNLKNLSNWCNANKISLNVSKTELIVCKHKIHCLYMLFQNYNYSYFLFSCKMYIDITGKLNELILFTCKKIIWIIFQEG